VRLVISENAQIVDILLVHLLYLSASHQQVNEYEFVDFDRGMTDCTSVSKPND